MGIEYPDGHITDQDKVETGHTAYSPSESTPIGDQKEKFYIGETGILSETELKEHNSRNTQKSNQ